MKIRTVEIAVGAFVIAGIASLLMLALQVSGLRNFLREDSGYTVKAEFSNIGGLKVRAKVSLAGVVVGRVVKIALEQETYNAKVFLRIDPTRVKALPVDTHASILTAGLLGDNYISLSPGFSEHPLKEGDTISIDSTDSAMILEQLISKFVANQVSKNSTSQQSPTGQDEKAVVPGGSQVKQDATSETNPLQVKQQDDFRGQQ